jgi:hypothetical protein
MLKGAELKVLRGAEESLKITRNIAMELHFESERVRDYLLEGGFDVKVLGDMLYAKKVRDP